MHILIIGQDLWCTEMDGDLIKLNQHVGWTDEKAQQYQIPNIHVGNA